MDRETSPNLKASSDSASFAGSILREVKTKRYKKVKKWTPERRYVNAHPRQEAVWLPRLQFGVESSSILFEQKFFGESEQPNDPAAFTH